MASVPGGVGGRAWAPGWSKFCRIFVVSNPTKRRKIAFFEGCPVGWGRVPTGAGLVDGGVDQGPWLQERVGGA